MMTMEFRASDDVVRERGNKWTDTKHDLDGGREILSVQTSDLSISEQTYQYGNNLYVFFYYRSSIM